MIKESIVNPKGMTVLLKFSQKWKALEWAQASLIVLLIGSNLVFYHLNLINAENKRLALSSSMIDLTLLTTLLGIIIFSQIKKQLNKQARQSSLLIAVRDKILNCKTLEEVGKQVASHIEKILPYSSGAIYFTHPQTQKLEISETWGSTFSTPKQITTKEHLKLFNRPKTIKNLKAGKIYIPISLNRVLLGAIKIEYPKDARLQSKKIFKILENIANFLALTLSKLKSTHSLKRESSQDYLTGLFNRKGLDLYLAKHIEQSKKSKHPLSVIIFDIDFFKKFNDQFGHEAGNEVIKAVANILKNLSRSNDGICRYGGEEFIWALHECPNKVAKNRAEEIRKAIECTPVFYENDFLSPITISSGIATFPDDANTVKQLIEKADKALYKAKRKRNCVVAHSDTVE